MKNIIKFSILLIIVFFTNCSEESKDPIVESNGFTLRKDSSIVAPNILTSADEANVFGKFDWDVSNNGSASVSSYTLVVFDKDNDPNLEKPVEYSGTGVEVTATSRKATLTVKEFNSLINNLKTYKCSEMNIDVRIKSTLGANPETAFIQYSSPVNFKVTGYATVAPILAFVKDGNATNVLTEPKLAASAAGINNDFEGYMYLQTGSYKFYKPDACGDFTGAPAYGGSAGTIDTNPTATSIVITTEGHYFIKANLDNNTYNISPFTTFGVFGNGTRTGLGTGNHVPMSYNSVTGKWELTMKLIIGKNFRFKSNIWSGNSNDLIVPSPNPSNPQYEVNPPYIPGGASTAVSVLGKSSTPLSLEHDLLANSSKEITVPGTFVTSPDPIRKSYKITLDISKPRKYTYTLTEVN